MRTKLWFPTRAANWINARVFALRASPRWGRWVSRYLTVVTYTGRRSGRTFSTPVAYRRTADVVWISVSFPDSKTWWRNFLGTGGPISLHLDDANRSGHAVAHRDERGRVAVTVRLDD
ncbi:nitroreductase/quinone reductase family protein [Saccharopolyspora spinosa]|uniref:Uncharacterized protein DUF385 n=1 Tax=Saccharopolyspora spinosa TaxID=60894 RepID=A0A2N3XW82_SACSN|nr:nitroreductase/quinone reductase family protein [Saccharopolyspora spinosa]PKW14909.1 uncharacterized protein DUF385 [Saccharopolyspora spinosa]